MRTSIINELRETSGNTETANGTMNVGVTAASAIAALPSQTMWMAVVVFIVLPIACAYPFFQRYFVSGLTIGSVKE